MESVEVTILGQRYIIRGEREKEDLLDLAAYVDARIREAYTRTPHSTPLKAAILASLALADELQRLKSDYREAAQSIKTIEDRAATLISLID